MNAYATGFQIGFTKAGQWDRAGNKASNLPKKKSPWGSQHSKPIKQKPVPMKPPTGKSPGDTGIVGKPVPIERSMDTKPVPIKQDYVSPDDYYQPPKDLAPGDPGFKEEPGQRTPPPKQPPLTMAQVINRGTMIGKLPEGATVQNIRRGQFSGKSNYTPKEYMIVQYQGKYYRMPMAEYIGARQGQATAQAKLKKRDVAEKKRTSVPNVPGQAIAIETKKKWGKKPHGRRVQQKRYRRN